MPFSRGMTPFETVTESPYISMEGVGKKSGVGRRHYKVDEDPKMSMDCPSTSMGVNGD